MSAAPSTGAVSTPQKKPSAEHFQGAVALVIGQEKKPYTLHKDLLCFYSDYILSTHQFHFLTNMWILGDQHQIPLLQNQVMDELFAKGKEFDFLAVTVVPEIYAKTARGSPLRRAVIEMIGLTMNLENWRSWNTSGWTLESVTDFMLALHQARMSKEVTFPNLLKRDKCFFHVHGKDEHC